MLELAVRLLFALGLAGIGFLPNHAGPAWAWQAGLLYGSLSVFGALLDRHQMRRGALLVATALLDGAAVTLLVTLLGLWPYAGFVGAVWAWAAHRHERFDSWAVAPISAAITFGIGNFLSTSSLPILMAVSVVHGVLFGLAGVRLGKKNKTASAPAKLLVPHERATPVVPAAYAAVELPESAAAPIALNRSAGHQERLKKRQDIEAKKYQFSWRLFRVQHDPAAVLALLREFGDLRGIALYEARHDQNDLTIRLTSGDVPYRVRTEKFQYSNRASEVRLRASALAALKDPEDDSPTAIIVLQSKHRMIGMLWISGDNKQALNQSVELIEGVSDLISQWVENLQNSQTQSCRIAELEWVQVLSNISRNTDTPRTVLRRIARELWEEFDLDHLNISILDEDNLLPVASLGAPFALAEFSKGQEGCAHWTTPGFSEILVEDTHQSDFCTPESAIRARIGSIGVFSIGWSEKPYALLTVASHRKGAIDESMGSILRSVTAELGRTVGRLEGTALVPSGICTSDSFYRALQEPGATLAVLRMADEEAFTKRHGVSVLADALRKVAHRTAMLFVDDVQVLWRESDVLLCFQNLSSEAIERRLNYLKDVVARERFRLEDGTFERLEIALSSANSEIPVRNEVSEVAG